MGDYTKLIVNCSVKKTDSIEELKTEILDMISLTTSAYHCGGEILEVTNSWDSTCISLITQAKYGSGIEEFLTWLKPQIVQGMGGRECYAIIINEYSDIPDIRYLSEQYN